jgi:hypothetical protein
MREVRAMRGRIWTVGLAMAVVGTVLSTAARGRLDAELFEIGQAPAAVSQDAGEWTADTRNVWRDDDRAPRLQLNLRTDAGSDRWGFGVRISDLQGLPDAAVAGSAANVRFTMVREAGTFTFTGSFADRRGAGRYTFTPDAAYGSAMAALGFRSLAREEIVRLAVMDVGTAFVKDIRAAGQPVDQIDELVRFKIHGVTGAGIRELSALRIHGATPARIRELRAAGLPASDADDVVRLRIHNVTPEFIAGLKSRNYSGLVAEDYVKMRIHGVSLTEIDELAGLGYRGLGAEDLVRFRVHGVRPGFIRDMRGVGFTSADERDLVKMRIHNVSAEFVRQARADGLHIVSPDDAVDLAIHGRRWRRR